MGNLYFNTSLSVFRFDESLKDIIWTDPGRVLIFGEQAIPCSYNTGVSPEFLVDTVQFGDGYEQVSESGIHGRRDVFSVVFSKQRRVVANAIRRFIYGEAENSIYARRVSEWFWWLPPYPIGERTSASDSVRVMKVRCNSFRMVHETFDSVNINATFVESFEP